MACDLVSLMRGLDDRVPRYTSYPTADRFGEDVDEDDYRVAVEDSNRLPMPSNLSLYVHVPFCHSLCYYCGCNKLVTRREEKAEPYLTGIEAELAYQGALFDSDRRVDQLHLGGGTPTYLSDFQLRRLLAAIERHFTLDQGAGREFSIEIDPRTVSAHRIAHLGDLGFNRFSLGVQDFDPEVQKAINRVQPYAMVAEVTEAIRRHGDHSVSFDLIYGLPRQSRESFDETIRRSIALMPDRIALYRYAHLPERFPAQRLLGDFRPDLGSRLEMFASARQALLDAGYVAIGLDHYARPEDELVRARSEGSLQRNFQGYSTRGGRDLIGVGPSAIGRVGNCFVQTEPRFSAWLERTRKPPGFVRGLLMNIDDRIRAAIIEALMCQARCDLEQISRRFRINWKQAFGPELRDLEQFEHRGLVKRNGAVVEATGSGELALRQIARVFDRYLREVPNDGRYSRAL